MIEVVQAQEEQRLAPGEGPEHAVLDRAVQPAVRRGRAYAVEERLADPERAPDTIRQPTRAARSAEPRSSRVGSARSSRMLTMPSPK